LEDLVAPIFKVKFAAHTFRSTSCHHALHPKDGSSRVVQNVGILLQHCMASQPRKRYSSTHCFVWMQNLVCHP